MVWYGTLTSIEIKSALHTLIRCIQKSEFAVEYRNLQLKLPIHHSSKLLSVNPFLCDDKLVRVGGRLENSNLP